MRLYAYVMCTQDVIFCDMVLTIISFSSQLLDKLDDGYRLEKPHVSYAIVIFAVTSHYMYHFKVCH